MIVNVGIVEGIFRLQDQWSAAVDRMTGSMVKSASKVKKVGQELTEVGSGLTKALTLPIAAIGGAATVSFGNFDDAMNKSLAIMGDVSDSMRGEMSEAARQVGVDVNLGATKAAESYFFLASAGLDAKASMEALPIVANFAKAGNFEMARATDLLTDAQSALGLVTRDATTGLIDTSATMGEMVHVSDVLVKANTIANASVEQFATSLTTKAGTAMKQLDIEIESGVAVLAAWADQGVKAELAGERFNIVTRDLQTAYLKNTAVFKDMNIAVFDGTGKFRSMADIISDLERKLGPMSAEQQKSALMMLGFTDRSVQATQSLIGLSDQIRRYESQLREAGGITDEVAKKQLKSLWERLGQLKQRFIDAAIELGGSLAPMIEDLIPLANLAADSLKKLAEFFGDLPRPIQMVVSGLAAVAAAAGPVLVVAGALTTAWGTFAASTLGATLIPAIGSLISIITGPIGWIAAGTVLLLSWEPVRTFIVDFGRKLVDFGRGIIGGVIDWVKDWWKETDKARKFLAEMAKVIKNDLLRVVGKLVEQVRKTIREQVDLARKTFDIIRRFNEWAGITQTIKATMTLFVSEIKELWKWLGNVNDRGQSFTSVFAGILGAFIAINPAAQQAVAQLGSWVAQTQKSININKSLISSIDGEDESLVTALNTWRVHTIEMDQAYERLINRTKEQDDANDNLSGGVKELSEELKDALSGSFEGAIDFTSNMTQGLQSVTDGVASAGRGLGDYTDEIDKNRAAAELLDRAYQANKLSSDQVRGVILELNRAYSDGAISSDQLEAALKALEGRLDNLAQQARDSKQDIFNLGDTFVSAFEAVITSSGNVGDALVDMFSGQARSNLLSFVDDFSSGFSKAIADGQTASQAVVSAWNDGKDKLAGIANAISAAFAASSGETVDVAVAAMTAIVAYASGDYLSGIIATVGVIAGVIGGASASLGEQINSAFQALNEGFPRATFQELADLAELIAVSLSDVRDAVQGTGRSSEEASGFMSDWNDVLNQTQNDVEELTEKSITYADAIGIASARLSEFVDVAFEFGPVGLQLIADVMDRIRESGIDMGNSLPVVLDMIRERISETLDLLADRADFLLERAVTMTDGILSAIGSTANLTAQEIQFAATSAAQAFQAMTAAGAPLSEVVRELGPLFAELASRGDTAGVELTGAFSDIGDMLSTLSTGPMQALITKVEGFTFAVQAAGDMGLLTGEQYDQFGDTVRNAFNKMVTGGLDGEQALAALAPQLQTLVDLQQMYGFELDNGTQKLVDMATAQGLLTDKSLTTEDILIKGFDAMILALNSLIEVLGGVPVAFESWTTAANDAADASTEAGEAATDAADEAVDAAEDVEDAINDVGDSANDAANDIEDWGNVGGDSARLVIQELDNVNSELMGLGDSIGNVTDLWQAETTTMVDSWSGTADNASRRMNRLANDWIDDIDRVEREWRQLMGQMENDFGGSVVADAIASRSAKLAVEMSGDILTTHDNWTKSIGEMGESFLGWAEQVGVNFDQVIAHMSQSTVTVPISFEAINGLPGPSVPSVPGSGDPNAPTAPDVPVVIDPRTGLQFIERGQQGGFIIEDVTRPQRQTTSSTSTGSGFVLGGGSSRDTDRVLQALDNIKKAVQRLESKLTAIESRSRT